MERDCNVTLRRLAKPQPDYQTLINNGVPWTDVDFSFGSFTHRLWNDVASRNYSLFGQFGARPEHPGLIEFLFMTKSFNKAGVYAINLFYMGSL